MNMDTAGLSAGLFVSVAAIAVVCQFLAVAFGIGYGTPMAPLLLLIGFSPLQVVPAVLLSQLAGGVVGGVSHHRLGNISLDFRRDEELIKERLRGLGYLPRSQDSKVILTLVALGIPGVLIGVLTAVNIPRLALESYIGAIVLLLGLVILLRRTSSGSVSWRGIVAIGIVGAFNKGISGAGFVPLVTGGQIVSGRDTRNSVGVTTVSIAIICAVGFLSYLLIKGDILWGLAGAATLGSVVAAPLAAYTVKRITAQRLKGLIALTMVVLGALTLVNAFVW